jgi:hypothetical protein
VLTVPAKQTQSPILVGSPRLATEVLGRVYVNPADAETLKSIQKGYIQETALTRGQANSLIGRLERRGLIAKGEFRVRLYREGEKQKVGIVHEDSKGKVLHGIGGVSYSESDREKLRSVDKAMSFIESQPNYRHDINALSTHMLNRTVSSETESALYHVLHDTLIQAQQAIVHKHGGKFTSSLVGRRKVYEWSKQ